MSAEDDYCDYGGTLKIGCEHCQTGEKNAGRRQGYMEKHSTPIADGEARPAQFEGRCMAGRNCLMDDAQIVPDQWIVRSGIGWAHEECVD